MTYNDFWNTCVIFGDQNLDPESRWLSLKYIHLVSQGRPIADIQSLIFSFKIRIETKANMEGFYFSDRIYENSTVNPLVDVTYIPISEIDALSFLDDDDLKFEDIAQRITNNTANFK